MKYVKVATIHDFGKHRIKSVRLLARPVGIIKDHDGSFYAIQVGCKHQNADITAGRIDGDIATCPWHGWRYNLRTGACLWGTTAKLLRHGLRIEGDDIYVTLEPIEEQPKTEFPEQW